MRASNKNSFIKRLFLGVGFLFRFVNTTIGKCFQDTVFDFLAALNIPLIL
jgi:hypothetical protein